MLCVSKCSEDDKRNGGSAKDGANSWLFEWVCNVGCASWWVKPKSENMQWSNSLKSNRYQCLCAQSCLTLCNTMDYSPPGCSVHEISQRILEWVAMPSSRRSSQPRDRTHVSYISCVGSRATLRATWKALGLWTLSLFLNPLFWFCRRPRTSSMKIIT